MTSRTLYCIDTSGLLDGWVRYYPRDILPDLWEVALPDLARQGRLIAPEIVLEELERKEDGCFEWAKQLANFSVPIDEAMQRHLLKVMEDFPRMVNVQRGRNAGDPWVVALARHRGAAVVSGEKKPGTIERPSIPLACRHYSLRCISMLEVFRAEAWRFGMSSIRRR